ncbi:MAG: MarC family protein, partial [Cyanobacteria bacterium P01_H01_bin.15]
RRQFAYKSAAIASFSVLAIALVGLRIAQKWYLSLPPLLMTSGVLLFLVSVNRIFKQYGEPAPSPSPADPSPKLILTPLTFPSILPPYGIALLVTILGIVEALGVSFWQVVLLVQFVMGLNLLAMLWARPILKIISPLLLQVVGIIMSVMQLALGISYIVLGIEFEILTLKILLDAQL